MKPILDLKDFFKYEKTSWSSSKPTDPPRLHQKYPPHNQPPHRVVPMGPPQSWVLETCWEESGLGGANLRGANLSATQPALLTGNQWLVSPES